MKIRKPFKKLTLSLALVFLGFPPLASYAATPSQDFDAQAKIDFQSISDYINGQFARTMGFYSTLGWNNPPGVYDLMAGPRVEVGVGAGADLVSLSSLAGLPMGALLVSSNISVPSVFPIPYPIGTLRVGLMNGLDAGLRLSIIPNINLPDFGFAANVTGWGLDLRFKILDGSYLPTLTGVVSWDVMNGGFSISSKVQQTSNYNDPNAGSVPVTMTGTDAYAQNWNVKSFGAKIMVGKDLGMIFPFGAVGFQRHSGTVSSAFSVSGTQDVNGSGAAAFSYLITSSSSPVVFEPKFVVGFDMGEGFHWGVVGESNGIDIAGSTSFRLEF